MEKGDTIPKYLTKFTHCRVELESVGVTVAEDNVVILALLGLSKRWNNYYGYLMGGRNYQSGSTCGPTWCKRRFGGTPEMDPHPNMMIRRIVP